MNLHNYHMIVQRTKSRYWNKSYTSADILRTWRMSANPQGYPGIPSTRMWYESNIHYPQFAIMVYDPMSRTCRSLVNPYTITTNGTLGSKCDAVLLVSAHLPYGYLGVGKRSFRFVITGTLNMRILLIGLRRFRTREFWGVNFVTGNQGCTCIVLACWTL